MQVGPNKRKRILMTNVLLMTTLVTIFVFMSVGAVSANQARANNILEFRISSVSTNEIQISGRYAPGSNDPIDIYYAIKSSGGNAPSAAEVFNARTTPINNQVAAGVRPNVTNGNFTETVTPSVTLNANETYTIYAVVVQRNDTTASNAQFASESNSTGGSGGKIFTFNSIAADNITTFNISNISPTGIQVQGQFSTWSRNNNTTGRAYWVVTEDSTVTAQEVKDQAFNGTSTINGVVASHHFPVSSGGNINIQANGSLSPNRSYYLYIAVEPDGGAPAFAISNPALLSTGGQNGLNFSTNEFPRMQGFSVGNGESEGELVRGVQAFVGGQARIKFTQNISFVNHLSNLNNGILTLGSSGSNRIQVRDTNGNNVAANARIETGNTLRVDFTSLQPNQRYTITVQPDTLFRQNSTGVYNTQLSYIFYTEKKPNLISASFEPGGHSFNHERSVFNYNNPNRIYHIDELIGVNKIGVGVNQAIVLQFDDYIQVGPRINEVRVESSPLRPDLRYEVEINPDDRSQLLITFDTDDPDKMLHQNTTYTVTIPAGALIDRYGGATVAQSDQFQFKFRTVSGFLSTFINTTANQLNQTLFRQYNANNIAIKIPKLYIRELETIHYRQGLIPDERVAPNLTNVAITADEDVATIRLETNTEIPRTLTRGANNRFTATFAGLNADITEMRVVAYDYYGKLLEDRSFRLKGGAGAEFQNDYVPQITNSFGRTISLYELMRNQQILRDVLEQIPVSELDRIGVFAPGFAPYEDIPLY